MSEQASVADHLKFRRGAGPLWRRPLPWTFVAAGGALIAALVFALQALGATIEIQLVGIAGMVLVLVTGLVALWAMDARVRGAQQRAVLWRAVGDALPFPCFVVDRTGRAVHGNQSFRKQWPRANHAPLAELRERLDGGERAAEQIGWLAGMAASGGSAAKEVSGGNGNAKNWMRLSVYPLGDRAGHVLWAIEDITARREMEHVICEEQAKLIDFLENAPMGFYSVDESGKFLLMNRTLASWLGTDMDEVRREGRVLHDFLKSVPKDAAPHSPFADASAVFSHRYGGGGESR